MVKEVAKVDGVVMSVDLSTKKPEKKRRRRTTKSTKSVPSNSKMATSHEGNTSMVGTPFVNQQPALQVGHGLPFPTSYPPSIQPLSPSSFYFGPGVQNSGELGAKIDFIISKISKLDVIETQQQTILSRLNVIEQGVANNLRMIQDANLKVSEIENSQKFLSDEYDKLSKSSDVNNEAVKKVQGVLKVLTGENQSLKNQNGRLSEDIIDLKCRSMRDNMVFTGITETSDPLETQGANATHVQMQEDTQRTFAQAAAGESCEKKVFEFCNTVLKIQNPRESVHIDRAHRLGRGRPGVNRAIVVKFSDSSSKEVIKNALRKVNLRGTQFGVFDQYPFEVQERRKSLIPVMNKARHEGKRAVLVRDKLYIDNQLYNPDSG